MASVPDAAAVKIAPVSINSISLLPSPSLVTMSCADFIHTWGQPRFQPRAHSVLFLF